VLPAPGTGNEAQLGSSRGQSACNVGHGAAR
jgi:hypothetical protein